MAHSTQPLKMVGLSELKVKIINIIFGVDRTKCNLICEHWYSICKQMLVNDLLSYLSRCRVQLTSFAWLIIDGNGNKMSLEKLISLIASYKEGDEIVNSWYQEKQIQYLEKYHDFY